MTPPSAPGFLPGPPATGILCSRQLVWRGGSEEARFFHKQRSAILKIYNLVPSRLSLSLPLLAAADVGIRPESARLGYCWGVLRCGRARGEYSAGAQRQGGGPSTRRLGCNTEGMRGVKSPVVGMMMMMIDEG